MTYAVLALDLDGTLLTSAKRITERARRTLAAYVRRGGRVVLVTGRNYPVATQIAATLDFPTALVAHNGAVAVDVSGSVVYERTVPASAAAEAVRRLQEAGCRPFLYVREGEQFVLRWSGVPPHPALKRYLQANAAVVQSVSRLWPPGESCCRVLQVVAIEEAGRVQSLLDSLDPVEGLRWLTSGGLYDGRYWFLEGLHPEATKERALERLCARWNVSWDRVVAVGDNLNDLGMLQAAGRAIAVANAPEPVRTAADWIVPSNDAEGVAVAVEWLLRDGEEFPH